MSKNTAGVKSKSRNSPTATAKRKMARAAKLKSSDWYENAARSQSIQRRKARTLHSPSSE